MSNALYLIPYILQTGDDLYQLAAQFHTSVTAILSYNPLMDPYFLYEGQEIVIPVWLRVPTNQPKRRQLLYYALNEETKGFDKLSINQLEQQIKHIEYGQVDFGIWGITADVEITITPGGLVTAQVTNVKKNYDEAWVNMDFKTSVTSIERQDDDIVVNVQVKFSGLPNKVAWNDPKYMKWGPASDTVSTFERNYQFIFKDMEDIKEFETEDTESHYEGPEFLKPTIVDSYYSIEITPLTPTILGTSVNTSCTLLITVIKTNKETKVTDPASGVLVKIFQPDLGTISATELTTDANGKGIVYYTVPKKQDLTQEETEVTIKAKETMSGSIDSITLTVKKEESALSVLAEQDIMPSSPKYKNKIYIKYTGAGKENNNAYHAVIRTSLGEGVLLKSVTEQASQKELTLQIWPMEEEIIYYQWNGDTKLTTPLNEIITVTIQELGLTAEAQISIGIDLKLTGVNLVNKDFLPGMYNSFYLRVEDSFHKEADLKNLLEAFLITPIVDIEQIEYISPGLSNFNSNQQDIFSFIIGKVTGITIPVESSIYGLVKATVKKEEDGSWTLIDDFWGTAERFRPAVIPSNIGGYRYRFILKWVDDSNQNNNSIETEVLQVNEFAAEEEMFFTFFVPTLRALIATFTAYGVIDTLMEASLKFYEGKNHEAVLELGTFFYSFYVSKEMNQQIFQYLLERNRQLIVNATGNELLTDVQVGKYMTKAYENYFPTVTSAFIGTLFTKLKNLFTDNAGRRHYVHFYAYENEMDQISQAWRYYQDFVKGYGTYGAVILSRVNLTSYEAYGENGIKLTEILDEIFAGGEPNQVICTNEDIISIPYELIKSVTVHLSGNGQQRMEETMYRTLSRLYIVTPDRVVSYYYPTYQWNTVIKIGNNEEVILEGAQLERAKDIAFGPGLYIDFNSAERGQNVTVEFTADESYKKYAWIGLIPSEIEHGPQDVNDRADIAYQYLKGRIEGTLIFQIPANAKAGEYQFRMFPDDQSGYEVASSKTFRIQ